MNNVLLRVLAVVLSGVSPEPLEEKVVPFDAMPAECAAVYDADIRQLRQATATEVITTYLNGDKEPELLIFNGNNGSGGETWVIMQKHNGKYRKAGEVFGFLSSVKPGLLVATPCGWDGAVWSYYELVSGELICKFNIFVEYSKPIRQEPKEIIVKILK